MIDYALWEVIENGATLSKTIIVESVVIVMAITTTEEKAQRRLEVKARSTLMMGIPNEHQLKFNSIKDAKKLVETVEKRFDGNAATRKTQRNLLKNKDNLDTMSMDDHYNNLKAYKPEVKGMSSSSSSTQNMAFVSSSNHNTSNTNEVVNTAHGVSTASTQVNDLQQIHPDDMEEMDLRWQMTMLTMRARRFLKNTERKLTVNGNKTIGFDKSKVECYNCHKRGYFARECRAPRNQDNKNKESLRRSSDQAEEGTNYALMAFSSSSPDSKGNPQMDLHDQGVIDSGCSRHMTGNMSYLTDYEEIDGGYVAFGGNPKGGKITRKAYTDSDYAGASLDRKSKTRGCQFLRCRLLSWQCKKQTVVANFITEAEYVAASSCCGQVLWIQNQY
ncbi:ribonuclease H-like domain-containing protein [Tanacetum coccineum]